MKANARQIGAALDAPGPNIRLFLLHGPDEAGAEALSARLGRALGPEAERVDFDAKALRESPSRLADEAASISLFGGVRYIRVSGADEGTLEAVTLLLNAEVAGNPVVMIGPGLKGTGKLVKLAIASPAAMSFACYAPEGIDAERLATALARAQGLRLTGDVAQRLVSASTGDRNVMSREIEKLALYLDAGPDRPRDVDGATLDAIGADLGDREMFAAVTAIVEGKVADVGARLARWNESGGAAIPLLRQLGRRLVTLAELRAQVDRGASPEQVVESQRVSFREKASLTQLIGRWSSPQLSRAVERVRLVERSLMSAASAGEVVAEAECVAVARAAARSARR